MNVPDADLTRGAWRSTPWWMFWRPMYRRPVYAFFGPRSRWEYTNQPADGKMKDDDEGWQGSPRATEKMRSILGKANDHGEIGYAYGGRNEDWSLVQDCLDSGLIVYERDASIGGLGDLEGRPYQRRTIYRLTEAGRAFFTEAK